MSQLCLKRKKVKMKPAGFCEDMPDLIYLSNPCCKGQD